MRFFTPSVLVLSIVSSRCLAVDAGDTTRLDPKLDVLRPSRHLDEPGGLDCLDSLVFSDIDFDRKVNKTEYITYLELFGPSNFLADGIEQFNDLPLVLKSNFLILACLCQQQDGADPNCCVGDSAHLSNMGAAPDETASAAESKALTQICFLSEASIDRYVETIGPTTTPAAVPTAAPITSPTAAPASTPTAAPIVLPTTAPIVSPTTAPIASPTTAPIASPTTAPTVATAPTRAPTFPTVRPTTSAPTRITTVVPTRGPTFPPSATPTMEDTPVATTIAPGTAGPTEGSLLGPSSVPTIAPTITTAPSQRPADVTVLVTYIIAKKSDVASEIYITTLVAAMDLLAPQIASNLNLTTPTGRRLRSLQVAQVDVLIPTNIDEIAIDTVCPSEVPSTDSCEDITASIGLYVTDASSNTQVAEAYKSSMEGAIAGGDLQSFLEAVDPNSPVYVVGIDEGGDRDIIVSPEDKGLSGGAISGIILGSMVTVLLTLGLLAARRKSEEVEKSDDTAMKDRLQLEEMDELNGLETPQASNVLDKGSFLTVAAVAATAGASSRDPRERQDSDAGSSGWSSREGLSSVDEDSKTSHSTSAGMGNAEAEQDENSSYSESSLNLTYTELDHAIQKGDWAAVGVTAALLASQSHEEAADKKVNFQGDMNPDRAAELDRLVEAGDWAGVVAAAAKYDAQEAAQMTPSEASDAGASSVVSVASTRTGDSGYSGSGTAITGASGVYTSTGTTNSDSGSRGRKLEEIRAEVELLVEKVVPEEKDNIDEMMMQFRGREEELVETLRTMQEREVAQKARLEGQKRAKRDARQTAEQKKLASAAPAVDDTDNTWMEEIDNTPAEPDVHLIDTSDTDKPMNVEQEEQLGEESTEPEESEEVFMEEPAVVEEAREVEEDVHTPNVLFPDVEEDVYTPAMAVPDVEEDVYTPAVAVTAMAVAAAAASGAEASGAPSKARKSKVRTMEDLQEALKRAIDSEDWEKVAETAAGLSGKFNYDSDDDDDAHAGSTTSTDKSQNASTRSTDKSQKINELVDRGDWDAVVAVASQFAEDDIRSASTGGDSREIEERRARRQQRLKEEQEALEQADIWSAIADQTRQSTLDKAESEANQAATVAADWAIARSLSELKAADKAGQLSEEGSDSDSSSETDSKQEV